MKYLLFGAALCALTLTTQAQDAQQAPTNTDPTLMTVGGEPVSRRTNHGSASHVICVPSDETTSAASSAAIRRSRKRFTTRRQRRS
mgnify:CR=1 FL=1